MKRVSWKRGMRLSDELMRASDDNMAALIAKSIVLAANGRFGLLPSRKSFNLNLNIGNGFVDVDALTCLAVTKGGQIIDVDYDTRYGHNFNKRVPIPQVSSTDEYILIINIHIGEWKEVSGDMEEPVYSFSLITPDTIVPDNSMPIAHISFEDDGWREDDADFVPPCLFVSSYYRFEELHARFLDVLAALDDKARAVVASKDYKGMNIFWPLVQQLRIAADKERDLLTPMALLSGVQKCVSAFTCACDIDSQIDLTDAKTCRTFVLAPYNYKEAYERIKAGLNICYGIIEKVEKLAVEEQEQPEQSEPPRQEKHRSNKPASPTIAGRYFTIDCNRPETLIPVECTNASATVVFTTDGSKPALHSPKAVKSRDGLKIRFKNGYNGKGSEPEKTVKVSLMAIVGGDCSDISTYSITLRKSLRFSDARPV